MKAAAVWGKVRSSRVGNDAGLEFKSTNVLSTNIRKNFPKHKALHTLTSHARLLQLVTTLPDPKATDYRGHTRAIIQLVPWILCAYSACLEGGDPNNLVG